MSEERGYIGAPTPDNKVDMAKRPQEEKTTPISTKRLLELAAVAGNIVSILEINLVVSRERCVVRNLVEILLERR